jgi:hypothetical protein
VRDGAPVREPAEDDPDPTRTAPTLDEFRKTLSAIQAYQQGASKTKAITSAWGCSKGGGNKTYQRASWLFDQAITTADEQPRSDETREETSFLD